MNQKNVFSAAPALGKRGGLAADRAIAVSAYAQPQGLGTLGGLAVDRAIAVSAYAQPKSHVEMQMERRAAADAIYTKRLVSLESDAEHAKSQLTTVSA